MTSFTSPTVRHASAYYEATIASFCSTSPDSVLGQLAKSGITLDEAQKNAFIDEIALLREVLPDREGFLYMEFEVPRLASRIDVMVIIGAALFVLEFKCGADRFHRSDLNQTWDYALDLKNFHAGSHDADIFPILVATTPPRVMNSGQFLTLMVCAHRLAAIAMAYQS